MIKAARDAGIPVITFDADAPGSERQRHIGTDNSAMGRALGKELLKLRPEGGKYAMVSGGPAAANLKERVEGVRDALKGSKWTEVSGSPTYCNDDLALAVQQMQDLKTANAGPRRDRAGRRLADVRSRGYKSFVTRTRTPWTTASSRSWWPIR